MSGFTWQTLVALLAGILVHVLKQLRASRDTSLTRCPYLKRAYPDLIAGAITALVLWAAMPELATAFPDLSASLGIHGKPTILSSFVAGFIGNSFGDLLGSRMRVLTGPDMSKAP